MEFDRRKVTSKYEDDILCCISHFNAFMYLFLTPVDRIPLLKNYLYRMRNNILNTILILTENSFTFCSSFSLGIFMPIECGGIKVEQ